MIEVRNLTKKFGSNVAVDDLSFDVQPGRVTGFLGPNGSGKSTTMRCMVGLDRSDGGSATFAGRHYRQFGAPLHEVGILLDAGYVHPGRSGRNHLRWLAASNGLPGQRVDQVLELVGMTEVANRKLRSYSLGMKQRLGIAATLLGDPAVDHPRRAGERPRPRGHPMDPRLPQALRRRRAGRCSSAATSCRRWR